MSQHRSTGETISSRRFVVLAGWGALIGVPLAMVAGAAAEVVIVPAAIVIAFVTTRDGYISSLAPSYAPFAAAAVLPWLIGAMVLWGIISPSLAYVRRQGASMARVVAIVGGIASTIGGYGLAHVMSMILPLTRADTAHLLDFGRLGLIVSLFSGAIAGYVSVVRLTAWENETTIKRLIPHLALFACGLAVLLEGSIAAFSALGWL
ncbi:MAG TPA: hypothetical protein VKB76_05110 [Ktedonobacterales bacterium]|nr:hypothetical protein [Ktedonobacterales bacterium]